MLRKKRGWKQADLSAHTGLDRGHISEIENGKRMMNLVMADGGQWIGYDDGEVAEGAVVTPLSEGNVTHPARLLNSH